MTASFATSGHAHAPITSERVRFAGSSQGHLAGVIERPAHGKPVAWAVFAHCFTCSKNSLAATRISRALAERGIATLRFDFTGLGDSEGEFGAAGFGADVADILAAARWLAVTHGEPALLVGHSLGGAAVLAAAKALPNVRALVTMGAPATAGHVRKHIHGLPGGGDVDAADLPSTVTIGERSFKLSQAFVQSLQRDGDVPLARELPGALLVMHSPDDAVVEIAQAHEIYKAASHPKSFVALDGADHLLTHGRDAQFVAEMIVAFAARHVPASERSDDAPVDLRTGETWVGEHDHVFWRAMRAGSHHLDADEPTSAGGTDRGPTPYDLLLMSLGACTSMTLRQYAMRKGYPLRDVQVRLRHERIHASDCAECEGREGRVELITRELVLDGPLNEDQRSDLLRIADRCPVHRTLEGAPVITTRVRRD